MFFLYILSWVSLFFQISLLTLGIGVSLYYMAEIIEEYTVMTKKIIYWMLIISCVIYAGLWLFEEFPITMVGIGLLTNVIGFNLLSRFPFIEIGSSPFIIYVSLVFVNHYLAFQFFAEVYHNFSEVISYFTLCLWLIPFTFFISLSASDNVLPHHMIYGQETDVLGHYMTKGKKKRSAILSFFQNMKDKLLGRQKRF